MFTKKYTLEDLKSVEGQISHKRKDYEIAIIDNESLPMTPILSTAGFITRQFFDIESVKDIEAYPIVLCDIAGVGKKFASGYEGAYLIQEIKQAYPQKYIIVASGYTFDVDYNKFFILADAHIKKTADSSDWINKLDKAISDINSPSFIWEKTRKYLNDKNLSLNLINSIEQNFIESFKKKDIKYINDINRDKTIQSNDGVVYVMQFLISFTSQFLALYLTKS